MIYRLDAIKAYTKRLVKKSAVKGITESGSTATDSYVYLESINLSKAAPTATIQFDFKGASGIRKKTQTVNIGFNLYDNSGHLDEYKNGFVVKSIDGRAVWYLLLGYATTGALSSHTGNTTVHITAAERTAWNAKQAAITDGAQIVE